MRDGTSVHAVVGIWTMDETRRDARERALWHEVVPLTRAHPGFVCGFWMQDPETGKGHTTTVFDTKDNASGFKGLLENRARQSAQVGITEDILAIVEVTADAYAPSAPPLGNGDPDAPAAPSKGSS